MIKNSELVIKYLLNGVVLKYKGKELSKVYKVSDNKLKYVVVGTGRCGTVYMAKLLTSLGIPCGHECIFSCEGLIAAKEKLSGKLPIEMSLISKLGHYAEELEGQQWLGDNSNIIAESSYMAVPFLQDKCLEDTKIIHVIRNPVKVINSFVHGFKYFNFRTCRSNSSKPYHDFIFSHVPELLDESLDAVSRCALYWVRWNEMIEKNSKNKDYIVQQVEKPFSKLFDFLGLEKVENYYLNSSVNHKLGLKDKIKDIREIPNSKIRDLVIGYGRKHRYFNPIF